MSYHTILNFSCFWIWLIRAWPGDSTCYYPNGDIAPNYKPCSSTEDGSISVCCELSTSVCTTKGLCFGSDGYMYRGGCTDQSWKSESCPSVCANGMDLFIKFQKVQILEFGDADFGSKVAKHIYSVIVPCNPGINSNEFCCFTPGLLSPCCSQKFDLYPAEEANGIGFPLAPRINDYGSIQSSSSAQSSAQVPISVNADLPSSSSFNLALTSTVIISESASSTPTMNTASSAPPTSLASTPKSSSSNATKAVLGVGIPLGVLLLLLFGFLLFRERKNRVHTQELLKEAINGTEKTQGRKEQHPGSPQELEWGRSGLSELHSEHVP